MPGPSHQRFHSHQQGHCHKQQSIHYHGPRRGRNRTFIRLSHQSYKLSLYIVVTLNTHTSLQYYYHYHYFCYFCYFRSFVISIFRHFLFFQPCFLCFYPHQHACLFIHSFIHSTIHSFILSFNYLFILLSIPSY